MNAPRSSAGLNSAWAQWKWQGQEARAQQGWGSASHGATARRNSKSTTVPAGIIFISSRLRWNFIIIFILLQWGCIRDMIKAEADIQILIPHVKSVLCYPLSASCMAWLNSIILVFYPYLSLLPWASLLAWILWAVVIFFQPVSGGKHRHTQNRLPKSVGIWVFFSFSAIMNSLI